MGIGGRFWRAGGNGAVCDAEGVVFCGRHRYVDCGGKPGETCSMVVTAVLVVSVLLQIAAAGYALRLISITRWRLPWLLTAAAISLMAVRRGISLLHLYLNGASARGDLGAELVALSISCLMLAGLMRLFPLLQWQCSSVAQQDEHLRGLRALVGHLPPAIRVKSLPDARYVVWNLAQETLTGIPAERALGKTDAQLGPALSGEGSQSGHSTRALRTRDVVIHDEEGIPQYLLTVTEDITAEQQSRLVLVRRSAMLDAVTTAAERILRVGGWRSEIGDILHALGEAAGVSRVQVFENHTASDGHLLTSLRYEWTAPGATPQINKPDLQCLSYSDRGLSGWITTFLKQGIVQGRIRELSEPEQRLFSEQGVCSVVMVPIFAGTTWWGLIGLNECEQDRDWTPMETDALRAAASMLGAAIVHEQVQAALRESEATIRVALNATDDLFLLMDTQGKILSVNDAMARHRGAGIVELRGKCIFDFFTPEKAAFRRMQMEKAIQTGQPALFEDTDTSTAKVFHTGIYPIRGDGGRVERLAVFVHDMTEFRKMEETLRTSEAQNRAVLAALPDILFRLGRDGTYRYVSAPEPDLLALPPDSLIGRNVRDVLAPEEAERILRLVRLVLDTGQLQRTEYELRVPRGQCVFETRIALYGPDEVLCLVRDITDQRQTQEALIRASRIEAAAALAGGIGHDLNNLLLGVMGNADVLRFRAGLSEKDNEMLTTIIQSAERAAELSRQLLTFSGAGHSQPQRLNLNDVVRSTLHHLERSLPARVQIECSLADDLWPVHADPALISRVIVALCANAIEAIEDQGIVTVVTGNLDHSRIPGEAREVLTLDSYVCLSVEDTGCGMTRDVQDRAFEPFYSTKYQGRGLGLSEVHGIVNNHRGYTTISSHPGKGTIVRVFLPAMERTIDEAPCLSSSALRGSETVLLVDDDATVVDTIRKMLETYGYRVLTAHSGQEAVEAARTYPGTIHAAVLDMFMPGMNGKDVFPVLRQLRPVMKIILCTAMPYTEDAQSLLTAGASSLLAKPFRADDLAGEIRNALDRA